MECHHHSWFTQPSNFTLWLIKFWWCWSTLTLWSLVSYIQNSNFSMCPIFPRYSLGNEWGSLQCRWSPGGKRLGGCNGLVFLSQSPGKVFSEVFPALTRDCVFKDKWVCNTFHLHISFDPAWGHDVMISGSDQIVKSIFSHESRATWYEPRSCIWLRVTLHSRTGS